MTKAAFLYSLRSYLRPSAIAPWLVLGLCSALLAIGWQKVSPSDPLKFRYAGIASLMVYRVVALASAILVGAIVSGEVEQKTIVYLLTRPIPREHLLLARYAAVVVALSCIGIFSATVLNIAVFGSSWLSNGWYFRDLYGAVLASAGYSALFLLLSLLVNKSTLWCLTFAFGWELMVPNMPGDLYKASFVSYLNVLTRPGIDSTVDDKVRLLMGLKTDTTISTVGAWTTLLVVIAVLLFVSVLWFKNAEFVPKETPG